MKTSGFSRMKVGAPVAVLFATVVNAASACDPAALAAPKNPGAPDLSWALQCGATRAHSTRTLIAKRAATTIQSMDRYFGAEPGYLLLNTRPVQAVEDTRVVSVVLPPSQLHTESTHQHAAP